MGLFNLSKANERVAALETELAEEKENHATAVKEAEKATTALTTENADLKAKLAKAVQEKATAEAEAKTAKEKAATFDVEVERAAGAKALEIAANQGVPPVPTKPGAGAGGGDDVLAQLNAEQDPTKRMEFYRANKAKIDAAYRNLPKQP